MMIQFNWKVAGRAGEGIAVTGNTFGKVCVRHGLEVSVYGEYPSLIRGGHNTAQVLANSERLVPQTRAVDVLVSFTLAGVTQHSAECSDKTLLIVDAQSVKLDKGQYKGPAKILDVPLNAIAREATGASLASNVVSIGVSCYVLGLSISVFHDVLADIFKSKGEEIIKHNQTAAEKGYEFAKEHNFPVLSSVPALPKQHIMLTGNEAIGLGALSAGVQFYASYPMTPTSALLHFFAEEQKRYPLVVKHSEDEISAINQAIGASYAGVRAMTGTAGGGFALMVEAVSLAGITEVPLVVVEGQRPGPATGMPTWTCQADLQFVLYAGHGEFPKVVVAPGDVQECFDMTRAAFAMAEKYHTQVYIMGDKLLLESGFSNPRFADSYENERYSFATDKELKEDKSYRRFALTPEGYSPRSIPGMANGAQLTNSYEHDEFGYSSEDAEMVQKMMDKRMRKVPGLLAETLPPLLLGPTHADITIVCWGSTKMVVQEVIAQMNVESKHKVNAIHLRTLMPFHVEEFKALAKSAKKLLMIEGNSIGQAEQLVRQLTGIEMADRLHRYDGRPFYAEDIITWLSTK